MKSLSRGAWLLLGDFARQGFDWIWLLNIWQTGEAAQIVSRANAEWRHEFKGERVTDSITIIKSHRTDPFHVWYNVLAA